MSDNNFIKVTVPAETSQQSITLPDHFEYHRLNPEANLIAVALQGLTTSSEQDFSELFAHPEINNLFSAWIGTEYGEDFDPVEFTQALRSMHSQLKHPVIMIGNSFGTHVLVDYLTQIADDDSLLSTIKGYVFFSQVLSMQDLDFPPHIMELIATEGMDAEIERNLTRLIKMLTNRRTVDPKLLGENPKQVVAQLLSVSPDGYRRRLKSLAREFDAVAAREVLSRIPQGLLVFADDTEYPNSEVYPEQTQQITHSGKHAFIASIVEEVAPDMIEYIQSRTLAI